MTKKILVTSGGTSVPIDDVRKITNMSSGRFGSQIARAALMESHTLYYLHAKRSEHPLRVDADLTRRTFEDIAQELVDVNRLAKSASIFNFEYSTFDEYQQGLRRILEDFQPDLTILAAAVSDFGLGSTFQGKISTSQDSMTLTFVPLPKLIKSVKQWCPTTRLVGFKLLSGSTPEKLEAAAMKQINEAGSDLVVANDLSDLRAGEHKLTLFDKKGFVETIGPDPDGLAPLLLDEIIEYFYGEE